MHISPQSGLWVLLTLTLPPTGQSLCNRTLSIIISSNYNIVYPVCLTGFCFRVCFLSLNGHLYSLFRRKFLHMSTCLLPQIVVCCKTKCNLNLSELKVVFCVSVLSPVDSPDLLSVLVHHCRASRCRAHSHRSKGRQWWHRKRVCCNTFGHLLSCYHWLSAQIVSQCELFPSEQLTQVRAFWVEPHQTIRKERDQLTVLPSRGPSLWC